MSSFDFTRDLLASLLNQGDGDDDSLAEYENHQQENNEDDRGDDQNPQPCFVRLKPRFEQ